MRSCSLGAAAGAAPRRVRAPQVGRVNCQDRDAIGWTDAVATEGITIGSIYLWVSEGLRERHPRVERRDRAYPAVLSFERRLGRG